MSVEPAGQIVLAGAGKMGGALLAGWLRQGVEPARIIVQEPNPSPDMAAFLQAKGIRHETALSAGDGVRPSIIVVAVKPQAMASALPRLSPLAVPQTLVMSIAAGIPVRTFETHFAPGTAVVRAMPNTPAAIGRGITAAVGNAHLQVAQRALANALLAAVGEVVWLDDEALIDAVTAVSGSGPAYVFLLCEALADAGVAAGLDGDTALRLARATVSGAGELLRKSSQTPAVLRENVTSPGGTTAAALAVLMRERDGLADLIREAVLAAEKRGRELGS